MGERRPTRDGQGGTARSTVDRVRNALGRHPWRSAAAALSVLSAAVVFLLATELFPYHSYNHDEAVYLQQAAMLLEGRLRLIPPDPAPVRSFRPWFFIEDGGTLYPKYGPIPAAVFAVGMALGEPRLSLAAVAAGLVVCCYGVTAAAFDRRTGAVAAGLLVAAPSFLLTSSVFLPYAPTALLTWSFAFAYVRAARADRSGPRRRSAVAAGVAVGLAFLARPYTAVLFAAPFVAHACWSGWQVWATTGPESGPDRPGRDRSATLLDRARPAVAHPVVRNNLVVAGLGTAFVCVSLAYNGALTGSPLEFPYEAFAPRDGPGFGYRRILTHELVYTPAVALETNARVLWRLVTRWTAGGVVGGALGMAGLGLWASQRLSGRAREAGPPPSDGKPAATDPDPVTAVLEVPDRHCRLLLVGVALSVVAGNLYFWGNYNLLGGLATPGDGLIAGFGPFYHFDLLLVLSAFGARAAVAGRDALGKALGDRVDPPTARVLVALAVVVALPAGAGAQVAALEDPIERHAAVTEKYDRVYGPIEAAAFDRALVFVPTPYGDWLNHPFQSLRNDPGYDGPAVYALDRGPGANFAVVDAVPNRTQYRFTYRGTWTPDPGARVTPRLERLERREGRRASVETTVGVPRNATSVSVRLTDGESSVRYEIDTAGRAGPLAEETTVSLAWRIGPGGARVTDPAATPTRNGDPAVPIAGAEEIALEITFLTTGGSTVTYRQAVTVRAVEGPDGTARIELLWPPETTVCRLVTDCGTEGTYLPDRPDAHLHGVSVRTSVATADGAEDDPGSAERIQRRRYFQHREYPDADAEPSIHRPSSDRP